MSLIRACRSLALSTWLLSFCFVHLLCLDFTVAEKEEWYTAFVNITYLDPVTSEIRTEKTECGRYGEHSPKREARGLVLVPSLAQDRQACDPNVRFPPVSVNSAWVALVAAGNCTYREKIRNVANLNASAAVIYNVGSSSPNDTITMPHPGKRKPEEALKTRVLLLVLLRTEQASALQVSSRVPQASEYTCHRSAACGALGWINGCICSPAPRPLPNQLNNLLESPGTVSRGGVAGK